MSKVVDRPLARGVGPSRDVDGCRAAVSVAGGPALHKSASQVDDQLWRWQVADSDGTVLAESADIADWGLAKTKVVRFTAQKK